MIIFAEAIISITLLTILVYMFYGLWSNLCIDAARQKIFEQRDAIFDLAADGKLDFSSDEYRAIRSSLERDIRFAHELTWLRLAVIFGHSQTKGRGGPSELRKAVDRIENPETREAVNKAVGASIMALVELMVYRSVILLVVAGAAYIFGKAEKFANSTLEKSAPFIQRGADRLAHDH